MGWSAGDFRTAALEALTAQLPNATVAVTSRWGEALWPRSHGRPVLVTGVEYGWQNGPDYRPEPSTR
eukprot:548672-Alexandrium_andersonii.AAC.1